MPSPLGHALGGLLAGWLLAPPAPTGEWTVPARAAVLRRPRLPHATRQALRFAVLGMAADADFLFGTHSTYSHSVGAVTIVFLATVALAGRGTPGALRGAVAAAGSYGTHVLFDWLGSDTSPPIGIMALWPVSNGHVQSDLHVFDAISRRYWLPGFWAHNARAVARELVLLGPLLVAVWWVRVRVTPRRPPGPG